MRFINSNQVTQWLSNYWGCGKGSDNLKNSLVNDLHGLGTQIVLTLKITLVIVSNGLNVNVTSATSCRDPKYNYV
jgi:hypothetical protein